MCIIDTNCSLNGLWYMFALGYARVATPLYVVGYK